MKPFTSFLRMQLNVNYGISALKYRFTREKKKLWEPILIAVVIVISLLPLLTMYTLMMSGIFAAGTVLNQPEIVLTIAFLFTQLVILFFGIFYIMGMFYFSQDLESLVPLPLKPYEVVGGKFAVVMVNEYLTALPILLPPLIIYGTGTGQGLFFWIKSLLLIIVSPIIPLAAAALIIMILMRFINFRRYKDLFAIIGGFAAIFLGVGISMFSQNLSRAGEPDFFNNLVLSQSGLIELIGSRFPPSIWATKGLSEGGFAGLGYLILFFAVSVLLFLLLLWLSNALFYKALLAGQEVTRRKRMMTGEQLNRQYRKVTSPVSAIMAREWKILFRTPIYALNGLAGTLMGPTMVLVMFFAQGSDKDATQLFEAINNPEAAPYIILAGLGLMLFTAGMNLVASTSLSREGKTFWITKLVPVSAKQQVTAKFLMSYIISAIGIIITGVIMWVFMKVQPLWVLSSILVGMLGSVSMVALNLLLDVFHPKLIWNSEQEAMKQNMNGGIGMLLSLLILIILGVVVFVMLAVKLPMWLVFIAIGVVSVILGLLSLLALYAVADNKYRELEA
ncbi:MAG: hypothetical protein ABFD25_08325 [Clostridiaceae bacterium]